MPHIHTQSDFQRLSKPNFCYLCGVDIHKDAIVNSDHCPPEKLFHPSDRIDYPIKVKVHASCNHKWHEDDEKLSIFFDILHGGKKVNDPELLKKLSFLSVVTAQGVYQGITCFPLRPFARRIIRCAHALLYGGYLPRETSNHIHYPIPEIDPKKGNEPFRISCRRILLPTSYVARRRRKLSTHFSPTTGNLNMFVLGHIWTTETRSVFLLSISIGWQASL